MKKIIFILILFAAFPLQAEIMVEVMETWPAETNVSLDMGQRFYVRLKYTSDKPLRVIVRPFQQGQHANAASHPAPILPAGSGETLGWFGLIEAGRVDEYSVSAYVPETSESIQVLNIPVALQWQTGGIKNVNKPEWVDRLSAEAQALISENINIQSQDDSSVFIGMLISTVIFILPLFAILLSILAFRRWPGQWGYFGGLPLVVLALWVVILIIALARDPTSHNLWPFELLMWTLGTYFYLFVLWGSRKIFSQTG